MAEAVQERRRSAFQFAEDVFDAVPISMSFRMKLHFLRVHMDVAYREIVDWTSEMDRVRAVLQLTRTAFPAPSTLCRSFGRAPMSVWRGLLRASAHRCDPSSHGTLDAETAFSAIQQRFGAAGRQSAWYREFRQLVLTAAVYNLEQAAKQ